MIDGALGDLLPLALGVAISPILIIACILILFSPSARVNDHCSWSAGSWASPP